MKIFAENENLILLDVPDFDLEQTFDCGQCFRWEKENGGYFGVAKNRALLITKEANRFVLHGTTLDDFNEIWRDYFDLDRDYTKIKTTLQKDKVMKDAIAFGGGIRLLNQEPFECLISFIISASNNIPRIKKIINLLCENFGEKRTYLGRTFYTFPTAEKLSSLDLLDLGVIRAGFRDKYILSAAKAVACGMLDLEALKNSSLDYAKAELLKLFGVGTKVADCILLFSLNKYQSFPVDVWIKRIMEHCYFDKEVPKDVVSAFAEQKFGEYSGFAQQYLFYWARENKIGI